MIVASDDVCDTHQGIVNDGCKVIGRCAVRTEDDKIIELTGVEGNVAVDRVVNDNVSAIEWYLDADGVGFAGLNACLSFCGINVSAGTLIALEWVMPLFCCFFIRRKLFRRTEAWVCLAFCQQGVCGLTINFKAFGLCIRAKIAALVGTFVPVKTKPTHGAQDDLRIFVSGAGGIGVVDAQNKGSTVGSRKRPVIDSGACTSYMQLSGGRGGKAYTDLLVLRQGSS